MQKHLQMRYLFLVLIKGLTVGQNQKDLVDEFLFLDIFRTELYQSQQFDKSISLAEEVIVIRVTNQGPLLDEVVTRKVIYMEVEACSQQTLEYLPSVADKCPPQLQIFFVLGSQGQLMTDVLSLMWHENNRSHVPTLIQRMRNKFS